MESSGSCSSRSSSPTPSPKRQRVEAEEEAAPAPTDKLLSLPPKILDRIFARVPFDKLVRTSCLSLAWRHRWESLTGLDVDLPPSASARAIWRCAPPIGSFYANVDNLAPGNRRNFRRNFHRVARWLRALACKGVEEITLEFDRDQSGSLSKPPPPVFLGPALFSCSALVRLYLNDCRMPPAPPRFPGFPKLVTLFLDHVLLPFKGGGKQLEHLIEAAPDLDFLSLTDVGTKPLDDQGAAEIWAIRAPKLRDLLIITNHADNGCRIAEEGLPLLEEANIHIDCLIGTQDFIDFLHRISTVEIIWVYTQLKPCTVNPLEGITGKFEKLTRAELNVTFGVCPSFMSIVSLLRCAPLIEDIDIEAEDTEPLAGEFEMNEDFLDSEISDDLIASLKSVFLGGIKNYSNQMCFMKFILSKAKSLRSFLVRFDSGESNESYEQACEELKEYHKASPDVAFTPFRRPK